MITALFLKIEMIRIRSGAHILIQGVDTRDICWIKFEIKYFKVFLDS